MQCVANFTQACGKRIPHAAAPEPPTHFATSYRYLAADQRRAEERTKIPTILNAATRGDTHDKFSSLWRNLARWLGLMLPILACLSDTISSSLFPPASRRRTFMPAEQTSTDPDQAPVTIASSSPQPNIWLRPTHPCACAGSRARRGLFAHARQTVASLLCRTTSKTLHLFLLVPQSVSLLNREALPISDRATGIISPVSALRA
jgi:hypothetical protein